MCLQFHLGRFGPAGIIPFVTSTIHDKPLLWIQLYHPEQL